MEAGSEQCTPLSPHYAFVVQWATGTQIEEGRMHGRVEHVVSRQAIHFTSLDALLAFMARVLREEDAHEEQLKTEAARLSALDSSQT
jgi:truncated hemoglobin YjbI